VVTSLELEKRPVIFMAVQLCCQIFSILYWLLAFIRKFNAGWINAQYMCQLFCFMAKTMARCFLFSYKFESTWKW